MQHQSSPPDDLLQVVKVRGFRVDLDGLEAILAKCPHVTAPSLNEVSLTESSSFHAQGMFVGSLVRVYMFAGVRGIFKASCRDAHAKDAQIQVGFTPAQANRVLNVCVSCSLVD